MTSFPGYKYNARTDDTQSIRDSIRYKPFVPQQYEDIPVSREFIGKYKDIDL